MKGNGMSDLIAQAQKEFDDMKAKVAELNELMKEKSKVLMKEMFAAFFKKYEGTVYNIFWHQYTPHFNDGEACEFNVHDSFLNLIQDMDDEDFESDGEGSLLYDNSHLKQAKEDLAKMLAWEADPMAVANKYKIDYLVKYNRNAFDTQSYYNRGKTELQLMQEWKPTYYKSSDAVNQEINKIQNFLDTYPTLKTDFDVLRNMISSIDEDLMRAMFGDHAKVIVSKTGIEVEEYEHD